MENFKENVSLVVSSSDKYEDAWNPYFELIKKYWPEHPRNIYLITETKTYTHPGLDITTCTYPESYTWSERLYRTLEQVDTKYIIFSLEDFFLLDYVKQDRIEQCIKWMEEDSDIAVCRLFSSDDKQLKPTEQYGDFYIADNSVSFRVDTQVAVWNREVLMHFIDITEDPWAFEGEGTKRAKQSDKIFLWHYSPDLYPMDDKVFPYRMQAKYGYGIAWGHWLWENKTWLLENGIKNVQYYRLGLLSKRAVMFRYKHLYNKIPSRFDKMIRPFMRLAVQWKKVRSNLLVFGLKKGLKRSWNRQR